jgi:hypothetical protein
MTDVLIRKTETQREGHMTTDTDTGEGQLRTTEPQGLPQATRQWGRQERFQPALPAPCSRVSHFQNWENKFPL